MGCPMAIHSWNRDREARPGCHRDAGSGSGRTPQSGGEPGADATSDIGTGGGVPGAPVGRVSWCRGYGARPPMMRHDLAGMRLGLFRDRRTAVSGAATAALLAALEVADGLASKDPEDDIRD